MSIASLDQRTKSLLDITAFNEKLFLKKEEEKKEFNALINKAQACEEASERLIQLLQYEKAFEKALAISDTEKQKENYKLSQDFVDHINEYYAKMAEANQHEFAQSNTVPNILDKLDSTDKDKKDWLRKTWANVVENQAETYANRTKTAVTAVTDEKIAIIEEAGIQLTSNEKIALKHSSKAALDLFEVELGRLQENQQPEALSLNLQLKYALLILNVTRQINSTIDTLNKQRATQNPKGSMIHKKLDLDIKKSAAFANKHAESGDIKQILKNIDNFVTLERLDHQKVASQQTNASSSNSTTTERGKGRYTLFAGPKPTANKPAEEENQNAIRLRR